MDENQKAELKKVGMSEGAIEAIDGLSKLQGDKKKSRWPNVIVMAIAIALVAVGASYWNECNFNCPLVMVVYGGVLLALACLGILSMCTKCEYDDKCYDRLEPLFGMANFGILIWASVVVFGHYSVWEYEDTTAEYYCHYTPFMFSFVVLILTWVLAPCIMVCCCMCACSAAICACCCGKKNNEVSEAGKEMA